MQPSPCPVCLVAVASSDCSRLECGHAFHEPCIDQWLLSQRRPSCPVCRTSAGPRAEEAAMRRAAVVLGAAGVPLPPSDDDDEGVAPPWPPWPPGAPAACIDVSRVLDVGWLLFAAGCLLLIGAVASPPAY